MPATYEPIATNTLTGTSSQVTFSSIPQTYSDLRVVWSFKANTTTTDIYMRVNNSSANEYTTGGLRTTNGSVSTFRFNSTNAVWVASSAGVATEATMIIDCLNYTSGINKTILNTYAGDTNSAAGNNFALISTVMNTAAITRLDFLHIGGTGMGAGNTITLYGILRA